MPAGSRPARTYEGRASSESNMMAGSCSAMTYEDRANARNQT